MAGVDFNAMADAIAAQPDPPCDSCAFSHECTASERCAPFKFYVETGRPCKPPRRPPGEGWREAVNPTGEKSA